MYSESDFQKMNDMERDIVSRIDWNGKEHGYEAIELFWKSYISDMEEYNPWRDWKPEHY